MSAPLCKDCHWYDPDWHGHGLSVFGAKACTRPGLGRSPVEGRSYARTAISERATLSFKERMFGSDRCGPDGSHFESKGEQNSPAPFLADDGTLPQEAAPLKQVSPPPTRIVRTGVNTIKAEVAFVIMLMIAAGVVTAIAGVNVYG